MKHQLNRIIGRVEGAVPGPLVIALGALHGNEPAGVKALELVFDAIQDAVRENAAFHFKGTLLGLIGNREAHLIRQRFVHQDLNRLWATEILDRIIAADEATLNEEELEALDLYHFLSDLCHSFSGTDIVILDLHTTSAEGGVFSIPVDEGDSLELARHLGAPAILGLQQNIQGTLLGFAASCGFGDKTTEHKNINIRAVAFEAGQHEAESSVSRSAAAVIRCLRVMGNIAPNDLAEFYSTLSLPVLASVPPVVQFRYAHHIQSGDNFKMRPGYVNFQPVEKEEHLADDISGAILAPEKGLILMPLYQAKGSDGFFIVR